MPTEQIWTFFPIRTFGCEAIQRDLNDKNWYVCATEFGRSLSVNHPVNYYQCNPNGAECFHWGLI